MSLPAEPPFGQPPEHDAFGSGELAGRLADLVHGVQPPYAVSISGEWGIGKTTLMHQMLGAVHKLEDEPPLAVEVDLWSEDVEDLRRAIAIEVGAVTEVGTEALARGGNDAERARRKVAQALDRAVRATVTRPELSFDLGANIRDPRRLAVAAAAAVTLFVLCLASLTAPSPLGPVLAALVPAVFAGTVVLTGVALGIATTSRSVAPAAERVGLGEELRSLVSFTKKKDRKVLVVIDNLDRLTGEDALATLGEIRAFIEIPRGRCVFVIPIDREAFIRHCRDARGMAPEVARDYLEKFFNLNVLLTSPAAVDLRKWTLDMVERCGGAGPDAVQVAEIIADAADGSPRSVMRILSGTVARRTLIDGGAEPGSPTLAQIAFVEALATAFPFTLEVVGPSPRLLVSAREMLAQSTDGQKRAVAVGQLCGAGEEEASDEEKGRLTVFLLTHRSVPLDQDQIALILSLREERDWLGIARPEPLRSALRTGDAAAFSADLAGRDPDSCSLALSRAVDLVRHECHSGWITGAINGLNAIVPSITPDDRTGELRDDARRALGGAQAQVPVFSVEAVRFACGEAPDADPRLLTAADWASSMIRGRSEGPAIDPASCIELLRLMCVQMGPNQLNDAASSLATRSDAELAPLFAPGEHVSYLLRGPVAERDFELLCKWDATADNQIPQMDPCLDRLRFLEGQRIVLGQERLTELLTKLTSQVPVASVNWLPCFEKLAALLADRPAGDATDGLAGAWSAWPASPGDGLRLALSLPLQGPTQTRLEQAARTYLLTGNHDEVASLARGTRDGFGVLVREGLADRWIATKDASDADLAAEAGEEAIGTLADRIDVSPPPTGPFMTFMTQLVEVVLARRSAAGAGRLVGAAARYINAAAAANASPFAPILARLNQLEIDGRSVGVDASPVLACLEAKLATATEAELPALAAAAREFDLQGLDPAGRLSSALTTRSRELQTVDWATIDWLAVRHPRRSEVADALASYIERGVEQVGSVVPRLSSLARPLHGSQRVTEAVVIAAAHCPADEIRSALGQMRVWNKPKRSGDAYREALRAIGSAHPGLLDEVGF
ncbi:MAG: P-loop NTPase fold protein [Candidatus Limnocylindrales bacterium]|jgi:hypothetical protein